MKVYELLETQNDQGQFYKEWDLPEGFPTPYNFIKEKPPVTMIFPKYDTALARWKETGNIFQHSQIKDLQSENERLKSTVSELEASSTMMNNTMLELLELILSTQLQVTQTLAQIEEKEHLNSDK